MSKFEYLKLADTVAVEIANGALKPGDRLPPQRSFAYERKIAVSTASRVYTELLRRGLVVGEVGRGTFVSGETRRGVSSLTEPRGQRIDLEVNYPLLPTQSAMIARSLEGLERPEALDVALRQTSITGTQAARTISAEFLSQRGIADQPLDCGEQVRSRNAVDQKAGLLMNHDVLDTADIESNGRHPARRSFQQGLPERFLDRGRDIKIGRVEDEWHQPLTPDDSKGSRR